MKRIILVITLFATLLMGACFVYAGDEPGPVVGYYSDLVDKINEANDGDTIYLERTIIVSGDNTLGVSDKTITLKQAESFTGKNLVTLAPAAGKTAILQNITFEGTDETVPPIATFEAATGSNKGTVYLKNIEIQNYTLSKPVIDSFYTEFHMEGCSIHDNTITGKPVLQVNNRQSYLEDCTICDNESSGDGTCSFYNTASLTGCTITGNTVLGESSLGGGLFLRGANNSISSCAISDNTAAYGGGIYDAGGCTITDTFLYDNHANKGDDYYTSGGCPLNINYSTTMSAIYTSEGAIGYYQDSQYYYFGNPEWYYSNAFLFVGETVSQSYTSMNYGLKFAFTSDLPPVITTATDLIAAINNLNDGDIVYLGDKIIVEDDMVIGDETKNIIIGVSTDNTSDVMFEMIPSEGHSATLTNLTITGNNANHNMVKTYKDGDVPVSSAGIVYLSNIAVVNFWQAVDIIDAQGGTINIDNCKFDSNYTGMQSLLKTSSTVLKMTNTTLQYNTCSGSNGTCDISGDAEILSSYFYSNGNGSTGEGGALCLRSGTQTISGCAIQSNYAGKGGGIMAYVDCNIVDCCIYGNYANNGYGADYCAGANAKLSVSYSDTMAATYNMENARGYYLDSSDNPFSDMMNPSEHANLTYVGKWIDRKSVINGYGLKFAFTEDLPFDEEEHDEAPEKASFGLASDLQEEENDDDHSSGGGSYVYYVPSSQIVKKKLILKCGDAEIDTSTKVALEGYGDGKLHLEDNLTRAQLATIVYRLLDSKTIEKYDKKDGGFNDVTEDAWYYKYVSTLHNARIVEGTTDTTYNPEGHVTWTQAITIFCRFVTAEEYEIKNLSAPDWAVTYAKTALAKGWIKDTTGFDLNTAITRGELMDLYNNSILK